jgi:diadenosine tetraphosphate (Ap4A) HIT family hydrolase
MTDCPLCRINLEAEKVFYKNEKFVILRTHKLKGHKERIMVMSKKHVQKFSRETEKEGIALLEQVGRNAFRDSYKFVIMEGTFASIQDHWHYVATDLDPSSEDFMQILKTRWLKVVDLI